MKKFLFAILCASASLSIISQASAMKRKQDEEESDLGTFRSRDSQDITEKNNKKIPSESFVLNNLRIIKQCAREGQMFDFYGKTFGVVNLSMSSHKRGKESIKYIGNGIPISPTKHIYFDNFFSYELTLGEDFAGIITIGKINKNINKNAFIVNNTITDNESKKEFFLYLSPSKYSGEENYNFAMENQRAPIRQRIKILKYAANEQGHAYAACELSSIYRNKNLWQEADIYFEKYKQLENR